MGKVPRHPITDLYTGPEAIDASSRHTGVDGNSNCSQIEVMWYHHKKREKKVYAFETMSAIILTSNIGLNTFIISKKNLRSQVNEINDLEFVRGPTSS